jgi:hypothetical protein
MEKARKEKNLKDNFWEKQMEKYRKHKKHKT